MTSKKARKTDVLWDVEDCPILDGLDPKSIYDNIKSALAKQGYHGKVEIRAFKAKKPIRNDFELAGIKLKIAGNNYGRCEAMVNATISLQSGSNLMVISRDTARFHYLGHSEVNLLVAKPANSPENCCKCGCVLDKTPSENENIISKEWLWTSQAYGGGPITKTEKQEHIANSDSEPVTETENQESIADDESDSVLILFLIGIRIRKALSPIRILVLFLRTSHDIYLKPNKILLVDYTL